MLGVLNSEFQPAAQEQLEKDSATWKLSFARHTRAQQTQNNMHACQKTCTKYADATENAKKAANRPQASVCRFYFFMILVFTYVVGAVEKTKTILRRGKRLVAAPFIARTNERNEYGRPVLERHQPFVSPSSDLLQAALECNSDVQFMDRAVPETDESAAVAEVENGAAQPATASAALCGMRLLRPLQSLVLHSYMVGIKAANVCDCCMTKYHAKAQQVLASALPWLTQGIRRCEAEELAQEEAASVPDKVLKRLRRMMFAANRCHWFSAAELDVFILTGGHCIQTQSSLPLFTCRSHFQSQECKRFQNDEDGVPGRPGAPVQEAISALLIVAGSDEAEEPQHAVEDADHTSDHLGVEDGGASEPADAESDVEHDGASEPAEAESQGDVGS